MWLKLKPILPWVFSILLTVYLSTRKNEQEVPDFNKELEYILKVDSVLSSIEEQNRASLDSMKLKYELRIDSFNVKLNKEIYERNKLKKSIADINAIIGELPDL